MTHSESAILPTTATELALRNHDILYNVFEYLALEWPPQHSDSGTKGTWQSAKLQALACAAQVCHAFSDPALDTLWRTVDNVLVLFRLFSSFQRDRYQDKWVRVGF